ncbi:MAG TPA: hypothetical protein VIO83_08150 [Pseudomonas sp.]
MCRAEGELKNAMDGIFSASLGGAILFGLRRRSNVGCSSRPRLQLAEERQTMHRARRPQRGLMGPLFVTAGHRRGRAFLQAASIGKPLCAG